MGPLMSLHTLLHGKCRKWLNGLKQKATMQNRIDASLPTHEAWRTMKLMKRTHLHMNGNWYVQEIRHCQRTGLMLKITRRMP